MLTEGAVLQTGFAGGPGLAILLLLFVVVPVLAGYWVYRDAKSLEVDSPELWGLVVALSFFSSVFLQVFGVLLGLLSIGAYLYRTDRVP